MDYSAEQVRQSLFALTAKGIKYDLCRITEAAAHLANPHKAFKSIHVAGTNGKGSTCAFIESILRASGSRTGLFTSPHLIAFEERFCINGNVITEHDWLPIYHDLHAIIIKYKLTFFEASMLLAAEIFKRQGVEWAVFETGMGGRLDATNILQPSVSVITRIAMDHREFLGATIEAVANEKLGIVKEATPLVIVDPCDDYLRMRIHETCARKHTTCTIMSETMASAIQDCREGTFFTYKGIQFYSSMTGKFQVLNALCAIEAVMQSGFQTIESNYRKGIATATLPGRFQIMTVREKTVIIDVGHNPDAAAVFSVTYRRQFPDKTLCIIAGIMADKDFTAMMAIYLQCAQHVIITRPDVVRAASTETLTPFVPERIRTVCPEVKHAVQIALSRPEDIIAVVGSFHTAGEALIALAAEQQ